MYFINRQFPFSWNLTFPYRVLGSIVLESSLAGINLVKNVTTFFYVHVTVHRNKFLCNKTNQMYQFPKFTPAWNFTCFRQFLCPSSGVYSLYTRHWYMSYRFVDSFRAGPFFIIKPSICTNFPNLLWHVNLHVSGSSSVIIRSLFTVNSALVYVIQVCK
jgi:hypothetical protein